MQQWHREEGHDPTPFAHAPDGDVLPLVSLCRTKLRAVPHEDPMMLCPVCSRLLHGDDTIRFRNRGRMGAPGLISD